MEASFDVANTWLLRCLQSHPKCRETLEIDRANPTRLLKIAQDGSNTIQLILYPSNEPAFQYATVSHCWGTSQVWQLTAETLHRLLHGILITELGQTFQDVIYATTSLGLQYIWIDSLCIFQDSKADWEHEAPRMSDVYKNATVNIAASVAANNQAGCLPAGASAIVSPCYVQSHWTDCDKNDNFHMYYDNLWPLAFEGMPLMTRAWVVQELLLAPRVLHMTGTQFYWQCYDLTACESYPQGIPPDLKPEEVPRDILCYAVHHVGSELSDIYSNPTSDPLGELQRLWRGILERYTRCNLTYTSDKLVALAGLTKVMQQALNDQYCAGLWKSHLVTQLSWSLSGQQPPLPSTPRPSPYRAPSWSWACLDGPISAGWFQHDFPDKIDLINVLACEATNSLGNTTSTVTRGCLRLAGWLSTIQLDINEEMKRCSVYINGHWVERGRCFIRLDCKLPSMQLHCLPLFVDTHQMPNWNMSLLVLHQTGDVKGEFRRYGSIHLFAGDLDVEKWTDFKSLKNEAWLEHGTITRDGMQMLTII